MVVVRKCTFPRADEAAADDAPPPSMMDRSIAPTASARPGLGRMKTSPAWRKRERSCMMPRKMPEGPIAACLSSARGIPNRRWTRASSSCPERPAKEGSHTQ